MRNAALRCTCTGGPPGPGARSLLLPAAPSRIAVPRIIPNRAIIVVAFATDPTAASVYELYLPYLRDLHVLARDVDGTIRVDDTSHSGQRYTRDTDR